MKFSFKGLKKRGDAGDALVVEPQADATQPAAQESAGRSTRAAVMTGIALAFVVLTSGTYYLAGRYAEIDTQYFASLDALQLRSQQIAKNASEAARGDAAAFPALTRQSREFAETLTRLQEGDASRGMPRSPPEVAAEFSALEGLWQDTREGIARILSVEQSALQLRDNAAAFDLAANDLLLGSDELVGALVEGGGSAEQIYIATRQLALIQRMSGNIRVTLAGDEGVVTAADRFGRDSVLVGEVIQGLLEGNERLGIQAVTDANAREILGRLAGQYEQHKALIGNIMQSSVELFQLQDATASVLAGSDALLEAIRTLRDAYSAAIGTRIITTNLGNAFGVLALLFLLIAGFMATRESQAREDEARSRAHEARMREEEAQRREEEVRETTRRNQDAILTLLDEISELADGDLTANATVTEDITGAIADAFNYAIDALRDLVTNINRTSAEVAAAAQSTRNTAIRLSEASEKQTRQITDTTAAIREMADSMEQVSADAVQASEVAQSSVATANKGGQAVRDTISGMDAIRETIQETSKRIKRLGESSQEIGDIVGLIDDIADQTNILALNAAIQASMAGDAGRGFAVVADEVQRLAERAGGATKQIEALVKTIQSDTNEAVASMERSTAGVVSGAALAEGAGSALEEIESVSQRLADLIQTISGASRQQAAKATAIASAMAAIQEVTTQARAGTQQTALSVGNLAELANDLKTSVAGFRLPPGAEPSGDDQAGEEPSGYGARGARAGLG